MHASVTKELRVLFHLMKKLLSIVKSSANKGWVTQVPAAAVIPGPLVVTAIFGFKAFVAGLLSL
jgi:hypothetical protein